MKRLALSLAALALLLAIWFLWPRHDTPALPPARSPLIVSAQSKIEIQNSKTPPSSPTAEVSHLADQLNSPSGNIRADLRIVSDIISTFRSNFPHDGNPVGNNPEITAALAGRNKFHVAFLPPGHPAINAQGELCDRWGTPFFFHAESGTKMEIRSAGPDKKMWTDDDVISSP